MSLTRGEEADKPVTCLVVDVELVDHNVFRTVNRSRGMLVLGAMERHLEHLKCAHLSRDHHRQSPLLLPQKLPLSLK